MSAAAISELLNCQMGEGGEKGEREEGRRLLKEKESRKEK